MRRQGVSLQYSKSRKENRMRMWLEQRGDFLLLLNVGESGKTALRMWHLSRDRDEWERSPPPKPAGWEHRRIRDWLVSPRTQQQWAGGRARGRQSCSGSHSPDHRTDLSFYPEWEEHPRKASEQRCVLLYVFRDPSEAWRKWGKISIVTSPAWMLLSHRSLEEPGKELRLVSRE